MLYTDVTITLDQAFTALFGTELVQRVIQAPLVAQGISLAEQVAFVVCALCLIALWFMRMQKASIAAPVAIAPEGPALEPERPHVTGRWASVQSKLDSPREQDWKLAILEADAVVDEALKHTSVGGSTFSDRLSQVPPGSLSSLDGLWWAHKIRNRIAHEVDYFLRYTEARQAISYYEASLRELGAL